jgi:hypothetical protein
MIRIAMSLAWSSAGSSTRLVISLLMAGADYLIDGDAALKRARPFGFEQFLRQENDNTNGSWSFSWGTG